MYTPEQFNEESGNDFQSNYNVEYRRRLIENNFELMNGNTIQVTTDPMKVPKFFKRLENQQAMKDAVA